MVSCVREEGLEPSSLSPGRANWLRLIPESRSGERPALPTSPPPGPVLSQDAPSPLFLPGFLLPFPVPHPVLGAGAEAKAEQEQRGQEPTRANGAKAPGCCWDLKQGKSQGPRSPDPSSLRPGSQSPVISQPSAQEFPLPSFSCTRTQESEPQPLSL